MHDFQAQRTEEFLSLVGSSLTDAAAAQQASQQQQAVQELGAYLQTARTFHDISTTILANRLNVTEMEVYALEHGLFPRARITLPLLQKIAAAYQEDADLLVALLHATQHQPVESSSQQADRLILSQPYQRLLSQETVPYSIATDRGTWASAAPARAHLGHWLLRNIAAQFSGRSFWAQLCSIGWRLNRWQMPHRMPIPPVVNLVAVATLCTLAVLHVGLLLGDLHLPFTESNNAIVATDDSTTSMADRERTITTAPAASREVGMGREPDESQTAYRHERPAQPPSTVRYQIIYTTDVLSDHRVATSPLIPVSGHELALIKTEAHIPKLVQLCRVIGEMESCPM